MPLLYALPGRLLYVEAEAALENLRLLHHIQRAGSKERKIIRQGILSEGNWATIL